MTYKIFRMYANGVSGEETVLKEKQSLVQAENHCKDPESCSSTCVDPVNIEHTKTHGHWVDGYAEE